MDNQVLLRDNLYARVLRDPATVADTLHIVAGYATPAMLARVLYELPDHVNVHLVVGMVGHEGIPVRDHEGFLSLQARYPTRVRVAYTTGGRSVHSKIYIWLKSGTPVCAFAGSSNFTQNGFLVGWRQSLHSELLVSTDPALGEQEFVHHEGESLDITHPDVDAEIELHSGARASESSAAVNDEWEANTDLAGAESIVLPLVARQNSTQTGTIRGGTHAKWGLNWGVDRGRSNRNEAVIPIPAKVWNDHPEFFPCGTPHNRPVFHVTTDDNKSLMLTVAEQGNKALHSLPSNGAIGEYFRYRLGVANGEKVRIDHLYAFGSRFVKIFKLDDESFHMMFSPDIDAEGARTYGFNSILSGHPEATPSEPSEAEPER